LIIQFIKIENSWAMRVFS